MNTNIPFIIFSMNLNSTLEEHAYLRGANLPFKQLLGCYKGTEERSYLVPLNRDAFNRRNEIFYLASITKQESILEVDSNRFASLTYLDGKTEHLGIFKHTKDKNLDAYSLDLQTGLKWSIA